MDSDDEEFPLPPSPSPAPRLRPRGPRGLRAAAAPPPPLPPLPAPTTEPAHSGIPSHQRGESSSSFSSYRGVATTAQAALTIKPSIRPVTDKSLEVVDTGATAATKSPYPTRPSQILYPAGAAQNIPGAFPSEGFKLITVTRKSGNDWLPDSANGRKANSSQINNSQAQPSPTNNLTTSDTPKVRNEHTLLNASLAPIFESPSLPTLHNEPRLVPLSAQGSRSFPYKTSPGEIVDPFINNNINDHYDDDYSFTYSSPPYYHYSSATGIDVDRLAMVEDRYNANNDHLGVPSFLTPRDQQYARHGSSSSPLEPGTVSTSQGSSSRLGAIASAASDLTFNSTPSSTGESVDSNGTVVRRKGYSGPLPAGYYSLFPPLGTPPLAPTTQATPSTNQPRSRRSSSAPPRPVSEGPLSPISDRTNSPVSPISPEDNDSLYNSSRPQSRSRAESLYNIGQIPTLPSVLVAGYNGAASPQQTIGNLIPRKPVARSNAIRWNSFMSTIQSESDVDNRNSVQKSSDESSSSRNTEAPKSTTSSTLKLREEFRRSSTALPSSPLGAEEVLLPNTSATLDFSQVDTAFPLSEQQQPEEVQQLRRRVSSAAGKTRMDSAVTYASLPSQPNRKQSNAITSPTSLYSTKPDYRDSYSQTEAGNRASRTASLLRESLPTWARLYYSNEARHRETLGRAPLRRISNRRHTLGSSFDRTGSLETVREREANSAQLRTPHSRHRSLPIDRSIFQGEDVQSDKIPHIFHSRAAAIRRRTLFLAPSIDEVMEGNKLTRRNVQIWSFAVGFIFPLAWWVAAVLPLPPCPRTPPASPGFEHDLEKTLGPVDLARYENARWWRNINRIMSVVGVGVIVAIIVLAVTASRMATGQYV